MKILKNTTINDFELTEVGKTVPANGQITLDPQQFLLLSSEDELSNIGPAITSGAIKINDGTKDLSVTDALLYIEYPDHAGSVLINNTSNNSVTSVQLQELINDIFPATFSSKPTYLANGEVNFVEIFNSTTQTTPNRLYRIEINYDLDLNPTNEIHYLYSKLDGTTVLKTETYTFSWLNAELTTSSKATV